MVTLAHLSDPHLAPVPAPTVPQLLGKRFFSHISWQRRRAKIHRRDVLDALGQDLAAHQPQQVAVTGDLVNLSLPAEFAAAADWLKTLGATSQVSVIPGNHDALVRNRWQKSWGQWADYMTCDLADNTDTPRRPSAFDEFPYAQIRPPLALVGLSSARPTAPFLAAGWIGKKQRTVLARHLRHLGQAGLFRVVLIHHPPHRLHTSTRRGLWDVDALQRTLAEAGAELILHGHTHKFASTEIETVSGPAPVIGVPSASAMSTDTARIAHYHLYTISRTQDGWHLEVNARGYDRTSQVFVASGGRCFELARDLPDAPARSAAAEQGSGRTSVAARNRIDPTERDAEDTSRSLRKPSVYVVGTCDVPVWRLSTIERLRRSFGPDAVADIREAPAPVPTSGSVVVLRADLVYDPAIIATMTASPNLLVDATLDAGVSHPVAAHVSAGDAAWAISVLAGEPQPGDAPTDLRRRTVDQLDAAHRQALRKREPPYVLRLDPSTRARVEWRTFQGAYKGVTDVVTKYLWPVPAFHVTRFCARLGLTPNAVTAVSLVLVVGAMLAFWQGQFLLGLAIAWPMTFLDTVDGKLARVTLTSSRFGNVFDHGIDLIHPPFWYVAWGLGLGAAGAALPADILALSLAVVVGGYVLGRLIEGIFILQHGIEIHVWRRLDSAFRLITARRNPNLILLSAMAIAGRPDIGVLAIAAWTAISLLFHIARLVFAMAASRRDGGLQSWLSDPVAPQLEAGA